MALDTPTPKYHAARHYFRFIRPGAVRINIPSGRPTILASAFHPELTQDPRLHRYFLELAGL